MATVSDTATGGGMVTGTDSWFFMSTALAKNVVYKSDITCDAVAQPKNVVTGPPKVTPKFKTTAGGGIAGKTWPVFPKSFTGTLGSVGRTTGSGSSTVTVGTVYDSYEASMTATAKATAAASGSAAAVSTVDDPWEFQFPATGSPKHRNLVALKVGLSGSFSKVHGESAMGLFGDMGEVALTLPAGVSKAKATVRLNAGWKVYLNLPFRGVGQRIRIPKALSIRALKSALVKAYNPKTMSMGSRKKIDLTFVKDVGFQAGSYQVAVSFFAREADADEGED